MSRSKSPPYPFLLAGALCATVGVPRVAVAASPSLDATVAAAKKSPLFKRELRRKGVSRAGLSKLQIRPGVTMDFRRYLAVTSLSERPALKPLMSKKVHGPHLLGAPVYKERIVELSDRIVVDRELTVRIGPGTCAKSKLPAAVRDLCFVKKSKGKRTKALTLDIAQIRAKLASAPAAKIAVGALTVAQVRSMTDEQLVALLLNHDTRTIRHVSIIPRKPTRAGALTPGTRVFGATPLAVAPGGGKMAGGKAPKMVGSVEAWNGAPGTFDTRYFLTGWTIGDEIDDSWEYTFANETFWHDRYYVRVDYHLGFGFGLRAPFSVDVAHQSAGGNKRSVSMKVAPVNVDGQGKPAFPAVGLHKGKYFGGKEFVLEFAASCKLKVAIPGPDVNKDCPKINKSYSRDINPVLGTDSSALGAWWLNGTMTGLGLSVSVASVSLDVGLAADVTNGKIGVKMTPRSGAQISGIGAADVWFGSRAPKAFVVTRSSSSSKGGFDLTNQRYAFDVRVRPKLRAKVGVDVWVYEKDWTLGPWALDFLAISQTFQLGPHGGTVAKHSYELFGGTAGKVQLPPSGGPAIPPKKLKQPGKSLPKFPKPSVTKPSAKTHAK